MDRVGMQTIFNTTYPRNGDNRFVDISIAKLLGYYIVDYVDEDGDDCYALYSSSGKPVEYEYDESSYNTRFFEDQVWHCYCPRFAELIETFENVWCY